MKKFLRTVFLMTVLAVMATGSAQAATVVTTETALKSAISSGASEIELGGHITLTSLSGISISNQTLTIDLQGYSLNGQAGTVGTDGADSSSGKGGNGTAGTDGGTVFALSNVNLTIKNGYVSAGAGGAGGAGGDGYGDSASYAGSGADGGDGADCIIITSKSTVTLDGVTLSGGDGGKGGKSGTAKDSMFSYIKYPGTIFGTSGTGGTAIQGKMDLTTTNNSIIIAGKTNNSIMNLSMAYTYGSKSNTSGFALYAEAGSDISISETTVTGYYTTTIWCENSNLCVYNSSITAVAEYLLADQYIEDLPIGYTSDHSGEAIKMVGSSNTLYLDGVEISGSGFYDYNYLGVSSSVYLENTLAELNSVTIYGQKHALETINSTVEITSGDLYVNILNTSVLADKLDSNFPYDAIGSSNSTITVHSGTIKGTTYTTDGVTSTSDIGNFIVGENSEITERIQVSTTVAGYCVVSITDIPPVIETQPQNTTVVAGGTASFSVSVTEGSSPVTYQWYYNTTGYNNGTGTATGTLSSLSVSTTSAMNGRYYHCKITAGSTTLYTNAAKLTVTYAPTAATVSRSPTTAVNAGTSITFTANVTGAGNPTSYTYQWYVGGSAVYGATSSTYTRTTLSTDNGKAAYCEVSNTVGSVNSGSVTMTVYYAPTAVSISRNPTTAVNAGTSITFTANVTGAGNPSSYTYQWYVSGSAISGATSSTYTRTTLSSDNGKAVYCVVSNSIGSLNTSSVTMTVYYAPTVTTPSNVSVIAGSNATFQVTASGGYPTSYSYQWYVGGVMITGATSNSYTFTTSASDNGKSIHCVVFNEQHFVTSGSALLSVQYVPTVECYASAVAVSEGESILFNIFITTQGNPSTYTYQWYIGGTPIEGATTSQLLYSPTVADSGKAVYCLLSSEAGVAMATPQVITVYPTVETADLITSITDISGSILGSALYKDSTGAVLVYDADGLAVTLDTTPVTGKNVAGYAELLGQTYPIFFSNEQESDVLQTKYPSQGTFYINPALLSTTTRSTPLNVYITMYSDEALTQTVESDCFTMYLSVDTAPPVVSFQTNGYTKECQVSVRDVVAGVGSISYSIVDIDGAIRSSGISSDSDFSLSLETGDVVTVTATDTVGNQGVSTSPTFVAGTGGILLPDFLFPTDLDASIYHYKTTLFDCYLVGGKYNNVD